MTQSMKRWMLPVGFDVIEMIESFEQELIPIITSNTDEISERRM